MTKMPEQGEFAYRRSGTTGCEIIAPDGEVVAWTVDIGWAGIITGLLNRAELIPSTHQSKGKTHMKPESKTPTGGKVERPLTREQVQRLVAILLKHRPDLVLVKTGSEHEKRQLVEVLGYLFRRSEAMTANRRRSPSWFILPFFGQVG